MAESSVRRELEILRPHVEAATGLVSRWNGQVTVEETLGHAQALFRQDGTIAVHPELFRRIARWRTLLHELVHSVAFPIESGKYDGLMGWEEGPVEMMQRAIRMEVMNRAGLLWNEEHIRHVEAFWLYEPYIAALNQIREKVGETEVVSFCRMLLRLPISQRAAALIRTYPAHARTIIALSAVLKTTLRGGTMTLEQQRLFYLEERDDHERNDSKTI